MAWASVSLRTTLGAVLLASLCGSVQASSGNTVDCIVNTGGGCMTSACFDWRGPSRCDTGRCYCTDGTCAGGDGICTNTPYLKPANNTQYRIRNARWPEYYMDVAWTGNVYVGSSADGKDNLFTVSMPGYAGGQEPLASPVFLIASVEWPESVLTVVFKSSDNSKTLDFRADVQKVDGGLWGLGADPSVLALGMMITTAPMSSPEGEVPVMLSSYTYSDRYMYVSSMGWQVKAHHNDPGAGGYWFFEPRLPEELRQHLKPYVGPRCSYRCGSVQVDAAALNAQGCGLCGLLLVFVVTLLANYPQ